MAFWTTFRFDTYVFALDGILFVEGYPVLYPYSTPNPGFPTVFKWLYPPIFLFYCGFVVLLFIKSGLVGLPVDISVLWEQAIITGNIYEAYWSFLPAALPLMNLMFKLPSILADIGIAIVLLRLLGGGESTENEITKKWIFNPFIIFITSIWGMFDILPAFVCLLAILFFLRKKYVFSGFLLAIGFGLKMYPVFLFFPLVAVALYDGNSHLKERFLVVLKLLTGAGLGSIFSIVPYLFYDNPITAFLYLLGARITSGGISSFFAHGRSLQVVSQQIATVFLSPDFLIPLSYFILLLIPLYFLILSSVRRTSNSLVTISALSCATIIALFLSNNSVTTQNFLWLLPFLFICSFAQKSWDGYIWLSRLALLGAFFSYSVLYFVSPLIIPDYDSTFPLHYEGIRVGVIQFSQADIILILIVNLMLAALLVALLKRSPDIGIRKILFQRSIDTVIPYVLVGLIVLSPLMISGTSQYILSTSPTTSSNFLDSSSLNVSIDIQNPESNYVPQSYEIIDNQIRVEFSNIEGAENDSSAKICFSIQSPNIDSSLASLQIFHNYTGNSTIDRIELYTGGETPDTAIQFSSRITSSSEEIILPIFSNTYSVIDEGNSLLIVYRFNDTLPSNGDTFELGVSFVNRDDKSLLTPAIQVASAIFFAIYGSFILGVAIRLDLLPNLNIIRKRIRVSEKSDRIVE
ncbi:MAG: hypothetical protein E4H14_07000 [Candidatus Thorarchaeota archaeon]|nr:MAG: hypothetical protein E4H14_07000 [Candidatus Thorarchaeota archaeon]